MPRKLLWILKEKSVPRVWIDDQKTVPQALSHEEGIDRRNHYIIVAVSHKDGLLDFGESRKGGAFPLRPRPDSSYLGFDAGLRHWGLAVRSPLL